MFCLFCTRSNYQSDSHLILPTKPPAKKIPKKKDISITKIICSCAGASKLISLGISNIRIQDTSIFNWSLSFLYYSNLLICILHILSYSYKSNVSTLKPIVSPNSENIEEKSQLIHMCSHLIAGSMCFFLLFISWWKTHTFHNTSPQRKSFVSFGVLYKDYLVWWYWMWCNEDTGCDAIMIKIVM